MNKPYYINHDDNGSTQHVTRGDIVGISIKILLVLVEMLCVATLTILFKVTHWFWLSLLFLIIGIVGASITSNETVVFHWHHLVSRKAHRAEGKPSKLSDPLRTRVARIKTSAAFRIIHL